jgi:hypothetical protein
VTSPISIKEISRESSSTLGGGKLAISGKGFAKGATVTIGGVNAKVLSREDKSEITVRIPANSAGTVSVVVTNPDTGSATIGGFTYKLEKPRHKRDDDRD